MSEQVIQIGGFAASVYVGLVFFIAAVGKWRHRHLLPGVIANYRLLPAGLAAPAAVLLPGVEMVVAVALLVGNRPVAPIMAIGLLLVFAGAMAINIGRGRRHIDCGCGHAGLRQLLGWPMVLRNLLMAAALSLRLVTAPDLPTPGLAIAVASGVVLYLVSLLFSALKSLPGQAPGGAMG